MSIVLIVLVALIVIAGLVATDSFYLVHTQEAAVVERLGKYHKTAAPGLNFKVPVIDKVRARVNLQVQQLEVNVETKTQDNVFVSIPVAVQYQVIQGSESKALYLLTNPAEQLVSYVQDNVRTSLATMKLDSAYESKDDIASNVEHMLSVRMGDYGWKIINTLVTDIRPAESVRKAMNDINAAQRQRDAAIALAEADKIKLVTAAEGEAEAKRLQGVGIANERKAIVEGLAEQIRLIRESGITSSPEEILMLTQHYDTLTQVAKSARGSVLFMPSNPGGMNALAEEVRNTLISTKELEHQREEQQH